MTIKRARDLFKFAWCRIVYGHLMIPFGNEGINPRERTMYMCARCLLCQSLHFIGRDREAE